MIAKAVNDGEIITYTVKPIYENDLKPTKILITAKGNRGFKLHTIIRNKKGQSSRNCKEIHKNSNA